MGGLRDVRLDRMRPRQVVERRRAADVAFLPLGNLEWHGVHNPLGLDAIKAHEVCCRAARVLGGGAVAPALLWGAPRDSFNVGMAAEAAERIAAVLNTEVRRWKGSGPYGGMDPQAQWLFYQQLLRMALEHIAGFGFRSIYICSGHGPLVHWVRPAAVAFTRASRDAGVLVTTDWGNAYEAAGRAGDHAGKGETSAMMAIDPALCDLGELSRVEGGAVGCGSNAGEASAEYGEDWLDACATAIAAEAGWLVANYPALPDRHAHHR